MANIPANMQAYYDRIAQILTDYCDEHLNAEYRGLCLHALEKLCRKSPSPLLKGRANTWAAGIVYAVGSANFIFDKSEKIHMTAKELAEGFGLSGSTMSQKGAEIRKMLQIYPSNPEWTLPSGMEDNPMAWMVELGGLPVDARTLPVEMQRVCYAKGLIPYVPADRKEEENDS